MSAWIVGSTARTVRHTSIPEPSGRRASSTATSGRSAGIRLAASAAVPASPTTSIVTGALEQRAEALTDHLVVVEQVDADHGPFLPVPGHPVEGTYVPGRTPFGSARSSAGGGAWQA